jgi:hypothetical protein
MDTRLFQLPFGATWSLYFKKESSRPYSWARFVSPENGHVSCLVDWQHAIIQQRLLAAGYPRAFKNSDTEIQKWVAPKPRPLETLPEKENVIATQLYRLHFLFFTYRIFNAHQN